MWHSPTSGSCSSPSSGPATSSWRASTSASACCCRVRRARRDRPPGHDQHHRPGLGRQRGLAARRRRRHLRRVPRVVREPVLRLLPRAAAHPGRADRARGRVRVPRQDRRATAGAAAGTSRSSIGSARARPALGRRVRQHRARACRSTPTTSTPARCFTLLNPYALLGGLATLLLFAAARRRVPRPQDRRRRPRAGPRPAPLRLGAARGAWSAAASWSGPSSPHGTRLDRLPASLVAAGALRRRRCCSPAGAARAGRSLCTAAAIVGRHGDAVRVALPGRPALEHRPRRQLTTTNAASTPYTLAIMTLGGARLHPDRAGLPGLDATGCSAAALGPTTSRAAGRACPPRASPATHRAVKPLDPRLLRHASRRPAASSCSPPRRAVATAGAGRSPQAELLAAGDRPGLPRRRRRSPRSPRCSSALVAVVAGRALLAWAGEAAAHRAAPDVIRQLRADARRPRAAAGPARSAACRSTGELGTLATRGLDGARRLLRPLPAHAAARGDRARRGRRAASCPPTGSSAVIVARHRAADPDLHDPRRAAHPSGTTRRQWRALAVLGHHFLDLVAGLDVLVAFGRARRQSGRLRALAEEYRRATMRTLRVAFLSALVLELLATLSVALVAVVGRAAPGRGPPRPGHRAAGAHARARGLPAAARGRRPLPRLARKASPPRPRCSRCWRPRRRTAGGPPARRRTRPGSPLRLEGVGVDGRGGPGARRPRPDRRARRAARAARAQRRRQVDAARPAARAAHARRGPGDRRRRRPRRPRPRRLAAPDRLGAPAPVLVAGTVADNIRLGRPRRPTRTACAPRHGPPRSTSPLDTPVGENGSRPVHRPAAPRRAGPRARSPTAPCCCSTSRPRASTPTPRTRSSPRCPGHSPGAAPSLVSHRAEVLAALRPRSSTCPHRRRVAARPARRSRPHDATRSPRRAPASVGRRAAPPAARRRPHARHRRGAAVARSPPPARNGGRLAGAVLLGAGALGMRGRARPPPRPG